MADSAWRDVENYAKTYGCKGSHLINLREKAKRYNDIAGYNGNILVIDREYSSGYKWSPGMKHKKQYKDDNVRIMVGLQPGYLQFRGPKQRWSAYGIKGGIWEDRRALKIGDGGPIPDSIAVAFSSEIATAWKKLQDKANNVGAGSDKSWKMGTVVDYAKSYADIAGIEGPIVVYNKKTGPPVKWNSGSSDKKSYSGSLASVHIGVSPGYLQFKGPSYSWSGYAVDNKVWKDRRALKIGNGGGYTPDVISVACSSEIDAAWGKVKDYANNVGCTGTEYWTMKSVYNKAEECAAIAAIEGPILVIKKTSECQFIWNSGSRAEKSYSGSNATVRIGISPGYIQFKRTKDRDCYGRGMDWNVWKDRRAYKIGSGGPTPNLLHVAFSSEIASAWQTVRDHANNVGAGSGKQWTIKTVYDKAKECADMAGIRGPILVINASSAANCKWNTGSRSEKSYSGSLATVRIGISPGYVQFPGAKWGKCHGLNVDFKVWKDRGAFKIGDGGGYIPSNVAYAFSSEIAAAWKTARDYADNIGASSGKQWTMREIFDKAKECADIAMIKGPIFVFEHKECRSFKWNPGSRAEKSYTGSLACVRIGISAGYIQFQGAKWGNSFGRSVDFKVWREDLCAFKIGDGGGYKPRSVAAAFSSEIDAAWKTVREYADNVGSSNGKEWTMKEIRNKAQECADSAMIKGAILVIDAESAAKGKWNVGSRYEKAYSGSLATVRIGISPGYIQFPASIWTKSEASGREIDYNVWEDRGAFKIGDGGPIPSSLSVAFSTELTTAWRTAQDYADDVGSGSTSWTMETIYNKAKAYADIIGIKGHILVIDANSASKCKWSTGCRSEKSYSGSLAAVRIGLSAGYAQFPGRTWREIKGYGRKVDWKIWNDRGAVKIGDGGPTPDILSVAFSSELAAAWKTVQDFANDVGSEDVISCTTKDVYDKAKAYADIAGIDGPILVINKRGSSNYKWSPNLRDKKAYSGSRAIVRIGISPGYVQFGGPQMDWYGKGIDDVIWSSKRALKIGVGGPEVTVCGDSGNSKMLDTGPLHYESAAASKLRTELTVHGELGNPKMPGNGRAHRNLMAGAILRIEAMVRGGSGNSKMLETGPLHHETAAAAKLRNEVTVHGKLGKAKIPK